MSTTNRWQPAPEDLAKRCETMFQNGGTRVYTLESDGRLLPTSCSGTRVAAHLEPDRGVLARRKSDGRYRWMLATGATR